MIHLVYCLKKGSRFSMGLEFALADLFNLSPSVGAHQPDSGFRPFPTGESKASARKKRASHKALSAVYLVWYHVLSYIEIILIHASEFDGRKFWDRSPRTKEKLPDSISVEAEQPHLLERFFALLRSSNLQVTSYIVCSSSLFLETNWSGLRFGLAEALLFVLLMSVNAILTTGRIPKYSYFFQSIRSISKTRFAHTFPKQALCIRAKSNSEIFALDNMQEARKIQHID